MKSLFCLVLASFTACQIVAQGKPEVKLNYQATATKINNVIHTKLEAFFDIPAAQMKGKVWLTVQPHFYATDSLSLDAKGMDIKEVMLAKNGNLTKLKYEYNGQVINMKLDKTYNATQTYVVYVDYVAKPNEVKAKGSEAITDAKGLYFINPAGEDLKTPTSFWTQGETEATSVWCPSIDRPNQKSTQDFYLTVPDKFVTLSNGLLKGSKQNTDGTRTDNWVMDMPHAPYLFFMAGGEFTIIKDESYKGKEISYYVEPQWESVAKKIFGNTPAMMKFFSERLGVEYPWQKYAQIVGREFVSGAMENTTATLHQESAYQDARQLVDGNAWETTIAHELFHHWFGDLVTAESWSNITVNESFADYSEYLWYEHFYGRDKADEENETAKMGYKFGPGNDKKDLVRFLYNDKEDVFDGVSYNKGGRILHMLRAYVGDEAFFASLKKYLTDNRFKAAEAHNLRLAFEETTGQDLNWYFNQWYFGSGHPKLEITYSNDDALKQTLVTVKQTQKTGKIFRLPIDVDIYYGNNKERQRFWMNTEEQVYVFNYRDGKAPDLVNFDGDKILLADRTDNKSEAMYKFQYDNAPAYLDRVEAIKYFNQKELPELKKGLNDKYAGLITQTLNYLAASKQKADADVLTKALELTNHKNKSVVRAAIMLLGKTKNAKNAKLFKQFISDSSYRVAGAALEAFNEIKPKEAIKLAKQMEADAKFSLKNSVDRVIESGLTEADFDFMLNKFTKLPFGEEKFNAITPLCTYLTDKVKDDAKITKAVNAIVSFKKIIPKEYTSNTDPVIIGALKKMSENKSDAIKKLVEEASK